MRAALRLKSRVLPILLLHTSPTVDHFPDAFYGQNNRIRDTLNNLILRSPSDWQTTAALPFTRIEGVVRCCAAHTPPHPRAPRHDIELRLPSPFSDRRVG